MPRFFTDALYGEFAELSGEDARHISFSLRMRVGEELMLCDGQGTDYRCRIDSFSEGRVRLRILDSGPSNGEPQVKITLFLALSKGEKMEQVIQKAVELGVSQVVPLLSARCISRPSPDAFEKKRARYCRIAAEAAKQCGRGRIPQVSPLISLPQLCEQLPGFERAIFFYERATRPLRSIPLAGAHTIAMVVGSEGGFEPEEAMRLVQAGALEASLGPRILRCETAPVAALAAVLYAVGEM